jgi:hypothetical protein
MGMTRHARQLERELAAAKAEIDRLCKINDSDSMTFVKGMLRVVAERDRERERADLWKGVADGFYKSEDIYELENASIAYLAAVEAENTPMKGAEKNHE